MNKFITNKMGYHTEYLRITEEQFKLYDNESSECNTQWFMMFVCIWIVVIAAAIIELSWRRKERRRKSEGRQFAHFGDLQVLYFSDAF